MVHKYNEVLTFRIFNETDLHYKVVNFLKRRYPQSLFTTSLGELQDSSEKRLDSFYKGYLRGSPDLTIQNLHKHYTGFCIEFKSPQGIGNLSSHQETMLQQYRLNGYKMSVSNDYDRILESIVEYFRDVRISCLHCSKRFVSSISLNNHIKHFHKIGLKKR